MSFFFLAFFRLLTNFSKSAGGTNFASAADISSTFFSNLTYVTKHSQVTKCMTYIHTIIYCQQGKHPFNSFFPLPFSLVSSSLAILLPPSLSLVPSSLAILLPHSPLCPSSSLSLVPSSLAILVSISNTHTCFDALRSCSEPKMNQENTNKATYTPCNKPMWNYKNHTHLYLGATLQFEQLNSVGQLSLTEAIVGLKGIRHERVIV